MSTDSNPAQAVVSVSGRAISADLLAQHFLPPLPPYQGISEPEVERAHAYAVNYAIAALARQAAGHYSDPHAFSLVREFLDTSDFLELLNTFDHESSCEEFNEKAYDASRKAIIDHVASLFFQFLPVARPAPRPSAELPTEKAFHHFGKLDVLEAWTCVRKNNQSIPDNALDDMRDVLYAALESPSPLTLRRQALEDAARLCDVRGHDTSAAAIRAMAQMPNADAVVSPLDGTQATTQG